MEPEKRALYRLLPPLKDPLSGPMSVWQSSQAKLIRKSRTTGIQNHYPIPKKVYGGWQETGYGAG